MSLSHQKLAAWYHQLAQQLEAGLTLKDALRIAPRPGTEEMAQVIESGGSVDDALSVSAKWLPEADRLFLSAAANAGKMPRTLQLLSARHSQLAAAKLRVVLACLYPAAVLHLALFLLPLVQMIDWEKGFAWSTSAYVRGIGMSVIPLWIIGLAIWFVAREPGSLVSRVIGMIPIVGSYLKAQSLAELSFALGSFLEAGVPIKEAWGAAGLISRSPALRQASAALETVIEKGQPPGPQLEHWPCFPPEFNALYRTGERTGQLEANLFLISNQNHERAQRALNLATLVYPGIMFLAVAAGVGYFIISVYGGYLDMLTRMTEE